MQFIFHHGKRPWISLLISFADCLFLCSFSSLKTAIILLVSRAAEGLGKSNVQRLGGFSWIVI